MFTDFAHKALKSFPRGQHTFGRFVRHLPSRLRIVRHRGQRLIVDPTELSGYYLYYEREYDSQVFNFLEQRLHNYTSVIDVGANIGVYTVFFAARVQRVDAFEPVPAVAARLSANLAMNGLNNVTIHETCIGKEKGSVHFTFPKSRNLGVGQIAGARSDIVCPCISLDEFLEGRINESLLLKIDIEGAEWLAIEGAVSLLRNINRHFAILLEIHPEEIRQFGGSVELLYARLSEAGLDLRTITEQGLQEFSLSMPPRFWWATAC